MSEENKEKHEEISEVTPLTNENNRDSTVASTVPPQNYYPPPVYGNYAQPPPGYYSNPGQPGYFASPAQPVYYANPQPGYYANPQPGYYASPNVHNDGRIDLEREELLRKRSKQLYCPNCRRYGWTKISLKTGIVNHLCCGYLCLIGCWLCCWIPYCCDECKDAEHFCEFCNSLLKQENPL